jgi:pSer/pThr/pTyr-binding forkhead associated (FHA) protein
MKLLSEYRRPEAAEELAVLDVPVLLFGMRGGARVTATDFRTSTREGPPARTSVDSALNDDGACVAPLFKTDRNPYRNFIFVGRASTCDVILRDSSVSKMHAVFELDGDPALWSLRDNRSHNGTWVNSSRIGSNLRVVVSSGDLIVFGACPVYLIAPDELRRIVASMDSGHG